MLQHVVMATAAGQLARAWRNTNNFENTKTKPSLRHRLSHRFAKKSITESKQLMELMELTPLEYHYFNCLIKGIIFYLILSRSNSMQNLEVLTLKLTELQL